ncbi:MAG: MBL fold metallo-hydrolase [SAR202 cluster bacterium]|nr:MBL fold metallo-hydrolase [SAR202 cluster bacterium]
MKADSITVRVLSDGSYLMDGGSVFGQVPRVIWEQQAKPDRRNRVRLGLNCLLVQTPDLNILVDAGMGTREPEITREIYGLSSSKLHRNLRAANLTTRDIDIVLLSHLHFDHVGGTVRLDREGEIVPTFPNARYLVQRPSWNEACNPNERAVPFFGLASTAMSVLERSGQLEFLDGDASIVPGVHTMITNGHCTGHQVVFVNTGGERIAFMGDLVPTPNHIVLPYITAFDRRPDDTLEEKRELLSRIEREGWLMVFAHGYEQRAGYLERIGGKMQLKPVAV